jgi:hypothetical protein
MTKITRNDAMEIVLVTAHDGATREWPLAEFDANPRFCVLSTGNNFETAKNETFADLAARRWEATQRFTYDNVDTVADSAISPLTAKILAMQITDPQGSATWKLGPGEFRTWNLAQMITYGAAINVHIQACFDREAQLSAAILAAATPGDLAAIDILTGWP